jgi:hypothetical protein
MSYQDTLKNILNFAQSMKYKSVTKLPNFQLSQQLAGYATVSLPPPSEPVSESIIPSVAAGAFSTAFAHAILEIRAAHECSTGSISCHCASDSVRLSSQLQNVCSFLEQKYHEELRIAEQQRLVNRAKPRPAFNLVRHPMIPLGNNGFLD